MLSWRSEMVHDTAHAARPTPGRMAFRTCIDMHICLIDRGGGDLANNGSQRHYVLTTQIGRARVVAVEK